MQTKFTKELTYLHQQALVSLRQNGDTDDVIIVEDPYIVSWQLMGANLMALIGDAHAKSTQLLQQLRGIVTVAENLSKSIQNKVSDLKREQITV